MRFLPALIAALLTATLAPAHFVYLVPDKDGATLKLILSDDLEVDDGIDAAKLTNTKLWLKDGDKAVEVKLDKHDHHLSAKLAGSGDRVLYATTDYGVLQKGDAKPFALHYHSKLIVGAITAKTASVASLPTELVPERDGKKIRFKHLGGGKPLADSEISLTLPGDAKEKVKTDKEGWTRWFEGEGRYAAWGRFAETKEGTSGDKKFSEIRHYATIVVDVGNTQKTAEKSELPELPVGFSSFGAAVIGDHLYVYGGHAGRAHSYSTETTIGELRRLDLKTPTKWEEVATGPKMQGLALVAHGGKLYRVGGMQPQNDKTQKTDIRSLTSFASFDPATGKWTDLAPLPDGRSSHDAVVVGDTLYVFGGWTLGGTSKGTWLDHGLSIDLSKPNAAWVRVKQPFQRRALTCASMGGKVYVICGLGEKGTAKDVNVFDPKTGEWSMGPQVPGEAMNGFTPASAVKGSELYLTPKDGKVYKLSGSSWDEVGKLSEGRFVARMVAGPDGSLLVIAGASPSGMLASVETVMPR